MMAGKDLKLQGGAGGSARSDAVGGQASGWMDGSNWSVNLGPSIGATSGAVPWMWIAVAAIAYFVVSKR